MKQDTSKLHLEILDEARLELFQKIIPLVAEDFVSHYLNL